MTRDIRPTDVIRLEPDAVRMLDQRRLPDEEVELVCRSAAEVATAISELAVQGATTAGIAAAMGIAIAAARGEDLTQAETLLRASRPTVPTIERAIEDVRRDGQSPADLFRNAQRIHTDAVARRRTTSRLAASRFPHNAAALTQCDTGALVNGGHGTALGAIRAAARLGRLRHVFVLEPGSLLGRGRLTSWELERAGIVHTIVDEASATAMVPERVTNVVVGADRIAVNGDTVSQAGTHELAAVCKRHAVQFDVVATTLTIGGGAAGAVASIDSTLPTGGEQWRGEGVVDMTPSDLISAIVTEIGVHESPYDDALTDAVLTSASIRY